MKSLTKNMRVKLESDGIRTVEALLYRSEDLKSIFEDLDKYDIAEIMIEGLRLKNRWFISADEWGKNVESQKQIFKTGCKALDEILGGGVYSMNVCEFFGEFGSGKSQILNTLLVIALNDRPDATAVYLDCENTFSGKRLVEIAKNRGYNVEDVMKRVIHIRATSSEILEEIIRRLYTAIEGRNTQLVVCDSLISHLRAEYYGREMLAERQYVLKRMLRKLQDLADLYNIGVAISNQVVAVPTQTFTPFGGFKATGGHIMAHGTEPRVFVRKGEKNRRIARIWDSSWLPPAEAVFQITGKGIEDV